MTSLIFRSTELLLKNGGNLKWYLIFFFFTNVRMYIVGCRAPVCYTKLSTSASLRAQKDAVLKNEVAFLTQEELEQKQKLQGYITVQPVRHVYFILYRVHQLKRNIAIFSVDQEIDFGIVMEDFILKIYGNFLPSLTWGMLPLKF